MFVLPLQFKSTISPHDNHGEKENQHRFKEKKGDKDYQGYLDTKTS